MSEGQQFHIPVTPMSIEKLTAGLLKCDNVRKGIRKTSYMRQKIRTDPREKVAVAVTRRVWRCTNACVANTNVRRITFIMTWIIAVTGVMRMQGK